jgi:hypothetical protein
MRFGKTLEQSGDLIWTYSFADMIVAPKINNWIWWLGANSPIWSKSVNLNRISEKNQKSIFLIYESFWFDIKSFWFVKMPPRCLLTSLWRFVCLWPCQFNASQFSFQSHFTRGNSNILITHWTPSSSVDCAEIHLDGFCGKMMMKMLMFLIRRSHPSGLQVDVHMFSPVSR